MKSKRLWAVLVGLVAFCAYVGTTFATPAAGFTGTTLAKGRYYPINESVNMAGTPWRQRGPWGALLKTRGLSDLYVQSNVWAPGGTTGWHTHPGPSLITVTAGTITTYEGDDPTCTPHVYTVGDGFIDPGDGHVHVIRNEGTIEARTITVQLIPADATRRIDEPNPGNCSF